MITEDYVGFETAKLLKEKGFDELCRCVYSPEGVFHKSNRTNIFDDYDNALLDEVGNADYFLTPTQAQVMKWLREVHEIFIRPNISFLYPIRYYCEIFCYGDNLKTQQDVTTEAFESPEEACEAAIKYCLENLI